MAFIYEIVPEKDYAFFNSMHLKSPLGKGYICLSKYTKWCADKENNVYLIPHGGGLGDTPHFADLWYDGCIINIEIKQYGKRINGSVMVGWNVINLFIPERIQNKTNFIVDIIKRLCLYIVTLKMKKCWNRRFHVNHKKSRTVMIVNLPEK